MVFCTLIASRRCVPQLFAALVLATLLLACRAEAQQQYKEMPAPNDAKTFSKAMSYIGKKDIEDMLRGNTDSGTADLRQVLQ